MNIPTPLLSELGVYEIQIHGGTLRVRVADTPNAVDLGVSELKSQLGTTKVVGLSIHTSPNNPYCGYPTALLELWVGTRCLVVQVAHLDYATPESLQRFLGDEEICFVGKVMDYAINELQVYGIAGERKGGTVELGELVARYLKKPNFIGSGLDELAREVEVDLSGTAIPSDELSIVDWTAKVFSEEEIKHVVWDAHVSYLIAKKIFG